MSIDIWTDCLSTLDRHVDRVSTTLDRYVGQVSIAGIDRHSTAGAFSTHDPAKRPTDSRLISIVKQLLLPQEFTSKSFLNLKHVLKKYR